MADSGQQQAPSSAKTPADFLKSIKGKPVIVKLNSGVDYRGGEPALHRRRAAAAASAGGARSSPLMSVVQAAHNVAPDCDLSAGVLACLDGYMNIAMEQTEEYVNGQVRTRAPLLASAHISSLLAESTPQHSQAAMAAVRLLTATITHACCRDLARCTHHNGSARGPTPAAAVQLKNKYGDCFIRGNNGEREQTA